jgi:hypothetical protein
MTMRGRRPRSWSDPALDLLFYVVLIGTAALSVTAAACTHSWF